MIISLQNGRRTIASVQKITRATNRKQKAEDTLYQASRNSNSSGISNSNNKNEALTPAPTPTKNKDKSKAKNKADSTCKSLRKKTKKT